MPSAAGVVPIGVSPDGMVGDDAILEIKCPKPSTHVDYLLGGTVPAKYVPQVQGQLLITDRTDGYFVSYCPELDGDRGLLIVEVERDNEYIDVLADALRRFVGELQIIRGRL